MSPCERFLPSRSSRKRSPITMIASFLGLRVKGTGEQDIRLYRFFQTKLFVDLRGTAREIRCCSPNVQASQLRPISGRSQFEVSEESLVANISHVGRKHGQHLLVGPTGLETTRQWSERQKYA